MMVIRVLSIVFVLVGIGLLAMSTSQFNARQAFIQRAWTADGAVTEVVPGSVPSRIGFSTVYHYKVRYTNDRGAPVEFVTAEYHSSPEYAVGEHVPVLYDPDAPQHAAINAFDLLWGGIGVTSILGGYFLAVGLCNLWITAVRPRRIRRAATLPELWKTHRAGQLTRDSEYQGLLVAFTFVGFALLGATLAVVLFGSTTTKVVMAALLVYTLLQIALARLKRRSARRD